LSYPDAKIAATNGASRRSAPAINPDERSGLETLRHQLAFAATYPDEAFSRYGAGPEHIVEVKAWALKWSTEIGLDIAESESWSDDEN